MRIGIVGLGLGGATTAAALAYRGLDVTVFEQAPEIGEVGAGVSIWASTSRLLKRVGMGEMLERVGRRINDMALYTPDGALLQRVHTLSYDGETGYTVHRAELLQALTEHIPHGAVRLGKRCVGAAQTADYVRLSFADGTTEDFDVVLGADGIRSAVQGAVVPPSPPKFSNLAAYRGLAENGPDLAMDFSAVWTDRKTGYLIAFPVSGGRLINFVGVVPATGLTEESWFAEGRPEDLAAHFQGSDPRMNRLLAAIKKTFLWGLYYRDPLPQMVKGRIALIGDAAHPMTPHAGMGFGQAIEDGFALGVLLEGCKAADAPERLQLYEKLRLPRTTMVQQATRRNIQFFHEIAPLRAGETRPTQLVSNDELIHYDVEAEAKKMLRVEAAGA